MAITNAQQSFNAQFTQQKDNVAIGAANDIVPSSAVSKVTTWANGDQSGEVNAFFRAEYAISASGSEVISLDAGLTDEFGAAFGFASIKGLSIINSSSSLDSVSYAITGDDFKGIIGINGGAQPLSQAIGITVSASDDLTITNGPGGTSTVQVIIAGVKA